MVFFNKHPKVTICKDRIRDLLIGFFEYYKSFDFINKIISPFEGREINSDYSKWDPVILGQSRSMHR